MQKPDEQCRHNKVAPDFVGSGSIGHAFAEDKYGEGCGAIMDEYGEDQRNR